MYIDIAVVVIILLFGLRGFSNGFINEVFGILGVVLGVFLATKYFIVVGYMISDAIFYFGESIIIWIISFVIILATTWIISLIIGSIISSFIFVNSFKLANHLLGFTTSALKYFIILSFVFYTVANIGILSKNYTDYLENKTISYRIMQSVSGAIMGSHLFHMLNKDLINMKDGLIKNLNENPNIQGIQEQFNSSKEKFNSIKDNLNEELNSLKGNVGNSIKDNLNEEFNNLKDNLNNSIKNTLQN